MAVSHHQNAGQNHNINTANKLYKNVAKFNAWEQHTYKLHAGNTRRKTYPCATPAIKNPTCSMLGSKSGPCVMNPVTN